MEQPYDETSKFLYVLSFIIGGNIGLPLILLAISFSKNVARHAAFTNWLLTWVLFSIINLLLLYAGKFKNLLEEPPFSLCFIQAAMIYAADAMIGMSALSLSIYIERIVHRGLIGKPTDVAFGRKFTIFFVSAPYGIFFLVFFIMIVAATEAPGTVHRSHFYCTMDLSVKHLGTALAVVFSGSAAILLAITLFRLHRCWRQEGQVARLLPPAASGIDLSLILRIALFSSINLLGTIISLVFISHVTGPVPNVLLSVLPLILALIFGTSPDLTRTYFICRRRSSSIDNDGGVSHESKVSISPV